MKHRLIITADAKELLEAKSKATKGEMWRSQREVVIAIGWFIDIINLGIVWGNLSATKRKSVT